MDRYRDSKRRKDRHDSDDNRREKGSKKRRSRSRSPNEKDSRRKRRHSRSKSPNLAVKQEKRDASKDVQTNPAAPPRKAKETDMLNTRTGGAYIPPARLRLMQEQITDKSSVAYQRLAWEALKKSIHGHINKINVGNIGIIIKELLKENIVRGRGLLCRSVIQAQAASPTFTNVYAALVAAVNSRFPNIGELLLKRLVIQFKRGFKRNDKPMCIASASFIAHLVNQRVAHEILALELLTLLVETPTDDSVEVSIAFLKECGQKLTEVSSKGVNAIFEMLRNILHEGQLDKRVQYMIEVMFQVWKDGFKDHPAVIEELELVPEEDQFTHLLMLDDATDSQDILNVFKFDDKYEENEQKYKGLCKEILGSDAESGEEGSDGSGSEESEGEEEEEKEKAVTIIDNTETNLVALRRTIYLTINSSLDFEECAHKLMKMQLKPGQEIELCHMFLDCCAEQRTYEKFYGLLAQRFCNINRIYISPFEEIFKDSYSTAHRLDTNRLRNVSKFFAHLLFTDSISWEVMECVKLNEEDTTSSSRIYIKILFQELAEYMGLKKLNDRLQDPTLQGAFSGIFPRDNPKNTRFSINFFTSIGLGGLTDELREHLKQMPKNVPAPITDINIDSETSSDSSSSSESSSSDDDSSSSDSDGEKKKKKRKRRKVHTNQKLQNLKRQINNQEMSSDGVTMDSMILTVKMLGELIQDQRDLMIIIPGLGKIIEIMMKGVEILLAKEMEVIVIETKEKEIEKKLWTLQEKNQKYMIGIEDIMKMVVEIEIIMKEMTEGEMKEMNIEFNMMTLLKKDVTIEEKKKNYLERKGIKMGILIEDVIKMNKNLIKISKVDIKYMMKIQVVNVVEVADDKKVGKTMMNIQVEIGKIEMRGSINEIKRKEDVNIEMTMITLEVKETHTRTIEMTDTESVHKKEKKDVMSITTVMTMLEEKKMMIDAKFENVKIKLHQVELMGKAVTYIKLIRKEIRSMIAMMKNLGRLK